MNILQLAAMLTLDGSRFKAGLKEAEVAASRFGNNVSKDIRGRIAGAFGTAAVVAAAKGLIDYNSRIRDTATALDISTKSFQEQLFWITQNGGTVADLTAAYRGLAKARAAALGGDGDKMGIFSALGIDQAELATGKLENIFAKAAEGFRNNDFGADRIAAVMEVFGKGGTTILPALSQSLSDASDEANRLGQVIDDGVNAKLEEMGDILDQLATRGKNVGSTLLLSVVRGIDMATTALSQGLIGLSRQALRGAGGALGMVGSIPGVGGFPAIRNWLWAQDQALNGVSDDLFNSMLDRYDPAQITKRNRGGRGAGLFSDEEDPEKPSRSASSAIDRLVFDRINMPDVPASEVSGLTRSGMLSGRSFAYSNREEERQLEIARETLKVERDQLQKLTEIARNNGKRLVVNP